jgi:hypothetical protein
MVTRPRPFYQPVGLDRGAVGCASEVSAPAALTTVCRGITTVSAPNGEIGMKQAIAVTGILMTILGLSACLISAALALRSAHRPRIQVLAAVAHIGPATAWLPGRQGPGKDRSTGTGNPCRAIRCRTVLHTAPPGILKRARLPA